MPVADLSRFASMFLRSNAVPMDDTDEAIVIGITADGHPVLWMLPSIEHAHHVLVLGSSGSGKTTVIAYALVEEFVHG